MEQHPVVISVCTKPGSDATYIDLIEALHKAEKKDSHFLEQHF